MWINHKNLVLYGTERLKKDFIYMFPKAKITGYIVNEKKDLRCTENSICTFKQINKDILKHKFLILCLQKDKEIYLKLRLFVKRLERSITRNVYNYQL